MGANTQLELLLENSKSKKRQSKNLRVTCPTGMGSHFDNKQLVCVSSKYLQ